MKYTSFIRATIALLIFTIFSISAQANVGALLGECMREYQVRHRALNGGANLTWPEIFDCRESGTPAPANPSDAYYSHEVEDPERAAELAEALLGIVTQQGFLNRFVSNYDELKAGNAADVEVYSASQLALVVGGSVSSGEAVVTLLNIRRAIHRLVYIASWTYQDNVLMKNGFGYQKDGWAVSVVRDRALNAGASYPVWNDASAWDNQAFFPNSHYVEGDIHHEGIALASFSGDEFIGFYEQQRVDWYVAIYWSGTNQTISPVSLAELRIIKGEIGTPKLSGTSPDDEVELFLKLDDLGTGNDPGFSGDASMRNPPVANFNDNRFAFYSRRTGGQDWIWQINHQYDESYKPSFAYTEDFLPDGVSAYQNGWLITDSVAIIKPDLTPIVDAAISCGCGPCAGANCPPGTPSYANSSISVTFPLGQTTNGRSAGYLMLHKTKPTPELENSSSLEFFPGEGASEISEPGVSRVFVAPTVRVHAIDDPDGDPATKDWKLAFYSNYPVPYSPEDDPYHEVNFEVVYDSEAFDRFEVTESGSLGNRRRDYVWKSETVEGVPAQAIAIVENGEIVDLVVEDGGSRYYEAPTLTLLDASGSGASIETEIATGVVTSIDILEGGSGYTEAPAIEIVEPSGSGASFSVEVLDGAIISVNVLDGGEDYGWSGDVVVVNDPGGGSGASFELEYETISYWPNFMEGISNVVVLEGGSGYSELTTLTIQSPYGTGAVIEPVIGGGQISNISVTGGGFGYTSATELTINGTGNGAMGTPIIQNGKVIGVDLIAGGAGYDAATEVVLQPIIEGIAEPASAIVIIEDGVVVGVEILSGGAGFSDRAEVRFTGGGGTGARARVNVSDHVVSGISVVDGGSGYGSSPTVEISPPPDEIRTGWELVYYDTDGTTPLKHEYKREGVGDDGNPAEIVTIRDGDGTTLSEVTTTFFEKSFGRHPASMSEAIFDPAGNRTGSIQTNYRYFENAEDSSYGLLAEKWQSNNGPWERRTYDANGRMQRVVRQHESSRINDPDSSSAVTIFEYSSEDLDDTDSEEEVVTTRTEYLLGEIVEKTSEIWWSGVGTGNLIEDSGQYGYREKWDVQYLDPLSTAEKLITKHRFYAGGVHDGKLRSVETPDGSIRIYEYSSDGLETYTFEGAKAGSGENVAKGTKSYQLVNAFGGLVVETTWAYPDDLLLTEIQHTDPDEFGRPLSTAYLYASGGAGAVADTEYATTSRVYGCCGLESETDENGITTTWLYDGLKRRYQTTRSGVVTTLSFDALGRVRTESLNGTLQRTVDYDSTGFVVSEENLFGNSLVATTRTFERSREDYNVETVDNPDGSQAVREYYKDGSLYLQTGSAVLPMRYKQTSAAGEVHSLMRRLKLTETGYVDTEEYELSVSDMGGRLVRTESPHPSSADTAISTSGYNDRGQLQWTEDADGVRTHYTYNAYFEPSGSYVEDAVTGPVQTHSSDYVYSAEKGRIVLESTSLHGDDASELLTEQQTPDGLQSWSIQYGLETHTLIERDDPSFSRRETTTFPDDTSVVATFDLNGRLSRTEQRDIHGVAISWTEYAYFPNGRLWKSTDGRNGETVFTYYDDGRLLSVVTPDPDPNQVGAGYDAQTTGYSYAFEPGGGVRTTVTLPDLSTRVSVNDALGRPVLSYGSGVTPSAIAYDYAGRQSVLTTWRAFNPATGTGSDSSVTQWIYNAAGLLEEKRYDVREGLFEPGPGYSYTAAGRLMIRTLARGLNTRYIYNVAGLLWKTDHLDDGAIESETVYDSAGRPSTVIDAAGTRTFAYAFGQLADETYTAGTFSGLEIDRGFDAMGRYDGYELLQDQTTLQQITHAYHPDDGRLQQISSGDNSFTYGFHNLSDEIETVTARKAGAVTLIQTREIDFLNRLESITTEDAAGATLFSYAYLYDDLNRRTLATLADNSYWQYGYDAMGQVEAASKIRSDGSPLPGRAYGFTFDTIGNRTSATTNGATTAYEPDALNQYDSITVARVVDIFGEAPLNLDMTANDLPLSRDGEAFYGQIDFTDPEKVNRPYRAAVSVAGSLPGAGDEGRDAVFEHRGARYFPPAPYEPVHDDDGNLLDDGRWTYTWNAENRLVAMETHILAVTTGVPRQKLEFAYDSQGRRFEKKTLSWNLQLESWELESHRYFCYDGWNLIAEFEVQPSDFILGTTYIWGLDMSGSLQDAGGVGGLLSVIDASSGSASASYYDGNGNVMGYVDMASAGIVAEFEYGPSGETILETGPLSDSNTFRFSTKFTDAETGLLYYGYRYYDSEMGRWLSRDPIEEQGGLNLYGFVGNDGVNGNDYLGNWRIGLLHFDDNQSFVQNLAGYLGDTFSGFNQGAVNLAYGFRNAAQGVGQAAALILDPTTRELAILDVKSLANVLRDDPCLAKELAREIGYNAASTVSDPDKLAKAIANLSAGGAISVVTGSGTARFLTSVRKVAPSKIVKLPKAANNTSQILGTTTKQLQKKFNHASDFGVTGNFNKANAAKFNSAINQHINGASTQAIQGTYRGTQDVIHHFDPKTELNVMSDLKGNFISGWKLSKAQIENLGRSGNIQ